LAALFLVHHGFWIGAKYLLSINQILSIFNVRKNTLRRRRFHTKSWHAWRPGRFRACHVIALASTASLR
jgi:hypothetical protein